MSGFEGFRANSQKTAIPNVFFTQLMPQIKDAAELRIVLHVFWAVQRKKGSPKFVTFRELLGDTTLAPSLGENLTERVEALESGLRGAVERGVLVTAEVEAKGLRNRLYLVNTEANRRALGGIDGEGVEVSVPNAESAERLNAFAVYENNVGPITPIIVEELKDAVERYSEQWVIEAIEEAVRKSARNWTYIEAILKNRRQEGGGGELSELPNLTELYRKNIGKVNPIILNDLKQAASLYPEEWIVDAIHEAVRNSATSWAYIDTILKNWREQGRRSGETGRHTGSAEDTEKYFKGRYGHLVQDRFD